ncbi:MAG: class II aldolase/adducin family protein [Desulfobacterales bacterium]|nr:class II aldolase/adducin family protein [Desulfobacterales bacterium]
MAAKNPSNIVDISDDVKTSLDKLALASRILEMEGHGNFTFGHLALRDPEGRGVWIKRWGMTLGEVQDWTDHQLIDFDGNLLYGNGNQRHSEWPIHAQIIRRRPEINVTAHTHPRYGTLFSCTSEPLRALSNSGSFFAKPPPRYTRTSELIRSPEDADRMVDILDGHPAIFLRNHGVVFCGESIETLIVVGVHLEAACQQQLEVAASGLPYDWPDDEERTRKAAVMGEVRNIGLFFDYFAGKLADTQQLGDPNLPLKRRNAL